MPIILKKIVCRLSVLNNQIIMVKSFIKQIILIKNFKKLPKNCIIFTKGSSKFTIVLYNKR